MALHGIDMPLSPIGSEAIFARVWRKFGLTEEEIGEFVTGGPFAMVQDGKYVET